jgi:DNA-binding transcriptional LysR family regulator
LHVTRAARLLQLTQSAASAAIAALERQYGVPLFLRVGRTIRLSDAGAVLLVEARAILQRARNAERALEEFSGLSRGHLRIYASQTIANYWLPARLHGFHRAHPQIALAVTIGNSAQVADAMLEGRSDLGFVEGEIEEKPLERRFIAGDRLVLVVGPDHPWAKRRTLATADLAGADWVLREPGSGTRQIFESALKAMGVDPHALKIALELPSNEAVRSAVEAGAGATAMSELAVASSLRHGALHAIALPLPPREFAMLRHPDRYHSRAEAAFVAMIEAEQRAGGKAQPAPGTRFTSPVGASAATRPRRRRGSRPR